MFRKILVGSLVTPLRVHSNRQLRRRLKHPIRLRALQRELKDNPSIEEPIVLSYEPTYVPEKVSFNGWSAPPETPLPGLPFSVKRTSKGLQLPVYRDYRNGNTRVLTILRRYKGDEDILKSEFSKVCKGKEVILRPGRMEVVGDYLLDVRKWLVGLGF